MFAEEAICSTEAICSWEAAETCWVLEAVVWEICVTLRIDSTISSVAAVISSTAPDTSCTCPASESIEMRISPKAWPACSMTVVPLCTSLMLLFIVFTALNASC
ncbi:hypothetical protein D3C73_1464770 [compost metagenome]